MWPGGEFDRLLMQPAWGCQFKTNVRSASYLLAHMQVIMLLHERVAEDTTVVQTFHACLKANGEAQILTSSLEGCHATIELYPQQA